MQKEETLTDRSEDDCAEQFATWQIKRFPMSFAGRRILIGHKEKVVGESLAFLLRRQGSQVLFAQSVQSLGSICVSWQPHVLLFDTRMDAASGFDFLRSLQGVGNKKMLLVAMSNVRPFDEVDTLKAAGFDAHCRRPSETWRIPNLLDAYFAEGTSHETELRRA
jgi:CheY-like chemotaxis protein